jgi:hypothetical protein
VGLFPRFIVNRRSDQVHEHNVTTLTADCKAEAAETVVVGPPAPPDTAPVGLVFAYPSRLKALVGRGGAACGRAVITPIKELPTIKFVRSCMLEQVIKPEIETG